MQCWFFERGPHQGNQSHRQQATRQLDASADATGRKQQNGRKANGRKCRRKQTQLHAPGGNWTQAAKGTQGSQTDASADARSKTDASANATGRKCRRKQQNRQADAREADTGASGSKCRRKRMQGKRTQVHTTGRKRPNRCNRTQMQVQAA